MTYIKEFYAPLFLGDRLIMHDICNALGLSSAKKDEFIKDYYKNDENKLIMWAKRIKRKCPKFFDSFIEIAELDDDLFNENINRKGKRNMIVKEARIPKYKYVTVLQGNYGYGWDDLCEYPDTPEGWKEQRADLKAYRENERGVSFRCINRRVLNPDYNIEPVQEKLSKKSIKEEMYHHIDNGYSMVTPNYKPAYIDGYKLVIDGTIDEVDNTFWFEEDEEGGTGGVQFFGICFARNTEDRPDYVDNGEYSFNHSDFIKFRWWFNVTLLGDPDVETKIYLDIDPGLIESDLFEYEVEMDETNISQEDAEDFIEKNAYEIGEFIWNVILKNAKGFGYAKSGW